MSSKMVRTIIEPLDAISTIANDIGKLVPTKDGHTSIFIYPYSYKNDCKNNNDIVKHLGDNQWVCANTSREDFHNISKLTNYIKETLLAPVDNKNCNLIFHKQVNTEIELWIDGLFATKFFIEKYELFLLEDEILLFSLFTSCNDTVQNISSYLNRELRNPECLFYDFKNNRMLSFDPYLKNIESIKMEYKQKHDTAYVSFHEFVGKNINDNMKFLKIKNLTEGKSKYAKHISAIHIEAEQSLEDNLIINFTEAQDAQSVAINHLAICSNLFAQSNDFFTNKRFEQNINHIRRSINEYGIFIWKYWAGMASLNSLAFISVNDGGQYIIRQTKNELYLIFLLNTYIKIRLQILDKEIINDNFMQLNKARKNIEDLYSLKARYLSEEIADSFQPLIIDKKIKSALGITKLLSDIQDNIVKTNEIVKDNNSTAIALIVGAYGISNFITSAMELSKLPSLFMIICFVGTAFAIWKHRARVGRIWDSTF